MSGTSAPWTATGASAAAPPLPRRLGDRAAHPVGATVRPLSSLTQPRERPIAHGYVAVCAWLLSASWGYDVYNWLRHGAYPAAWAANLAASSVLYALAGLCWSLTTREGVGVTFTFLWPEWPAERRGASGALVAWVLVFVVAVALLGLPFVVPSLAWW